MSDTVYSKFQDLLIVANYYNKLQMEKTKFEILKFQTNNRNLTTHPHQWEQPTV